jgi:cell division septum initiation protein DivIVA
MSIELLYIVPIIALVAFTFIISFFAQKKSAQQQQVKKLVNEVQQFNEGKLIGAQRSAEERLDDFEKTITSINKALSNQQKVIEKFQQENSSYNGEIDNLKKKLREMHKEYDIVVSQNYSLRAKFNALSKKPEAEAVAGQTTRHSEPEAYISMQTSQPKPGYEMNMSLFDETKVMSVLSNLDDTREIDISEFMK